MQIKSIKEKLDFEVEAQDECPHKKFRFSEKCSSDCEEVTWTGLSPVYIQFDAYFSEVCNSSTKYTCATMHKW